MVTAFIGQLTFIVCTALCGLNMQRQNSQWASGPARRLPGLGAMVCAWPETAGPGQAKVFMPWTKPRPPE